MDTVIGQLVHEFGVERGIESWPVADRFEAFAAHCVLNDMTPGSVDGVEFRTGGGGDGGIDAYAVVIGDAVVRDPDDLERRLTSMAAVSPTVVVVQAKSSAKMSRSVIADLRVRVENVLRTDEVLTNAENIEPLRECLRVFRKHLDRLGRDGIRLVVAYVNTSPKANEEILAESERAARALTSVGFATKVEFECIGRERLARLYERTQWSIERRLTFAGHYPLPTAPGVTQARQGVVPALDLVRAIAGDGRAPDPMLFSENIREYHPKAPVNAEIRDTLQDEDRRGRFAVLNNGVTIVARSMNCWDDTVSMRDFQIVNGCQTCHVLAEERDRLDGVMVKVQLIECDDDDVVNEVVQATNRQTEIPRVYFENRRALMKRLEIHYRYMRDRGRELYFGRKPGARTNDLRNRVVGMNPQLRAHVAMFGTVLPTSTVPVDVNYAKWFAGVSEMELFTAAGALYRWEWLVDTRKVQRRYRALGYQAIAALSVLQGTRPLGGSDKDKKRALEAIDALVWSDGRWELLAVDIQTILDDALTRVGAADPRAAAGSTAFGNAVLRAAREYRKR